jgi:hypothetical protein
MARSQCSIAAVLREHFALAAYEGNALAALIETDPDTLAGAVETVSAAIITRTGSMRDAAASIRSSPLRNEEWQ